MESGVLEGQGVETLTKAKPSLSLGMKPLSSFYEIKHKGGGLGLTETLGEDESKLQPSERGQGFRDGKSLIPGELIKGPDEDSSSILPTEAQTVAPSETQVKP